MNHLSGQTETTHAVKSDHGNLDMPSIDRQRSTNTRQKLISAGQRLLAQAGYEAVNSNAVAKGAGVTPPIFYRHFADKYDLLKTIGERLMEVQNEIILGPVTPAMDDVDAQMQQIRSRFEHVLDVTKAFEGAHAILVAMRAIPELFPVRLTSHEETARAMVASLALSVPDAEKDELYIRARVAMEIGHGLVEMLCEQNFRGRVRIVSIGVTSIHAALSSPVE